MVLLVQLVASNFPQHPWKLYFITTTWVFYQSFIYNLESNLLASLLFQIMLHGIKNDK